MASQLEELKKKSAARIKAANARVKRQSLEGALVRHGAGIATAATLGTLNRYGVSPTIGGFPWKPGVAALALIGEATTGGAMQAACAGVAGCLLNVYVERSISTGTAVAGEGGGF